MKPCPALPCPAQTRPPAAQESVKRAKTLPKEGIHPLLAAALPSDALGGLEAQAGLAEIAAALKSYRPSQTVFEAEVSSARKGQGAGAWATAAAAAADGGWMVVVSQGRYFSRRVMHLLCLSRPRRPPTCLLSCCAGVMAMPGMLAAAPYERRVEVMRQKRQAHAATIEASRRRGEGGARFASAATGDVSAPGPPRARKVEEEEQQGGSSGDEEQRGAAASDSDAEAAQRRQGGGGGGRKRKQFVLEAEPEQGCAPASARPCSCLTHAAAKVPARSAAAFPAAHAAPLAASLPWPRPAASTVRPASSSATPPPRTTPTKSFTRWETPASRMPCWTSPPRTRVRG